MVLALFFATNNNHIISMLSFIANFLCLFCFFYFGLPCLFPPHSRNPSASSPLFLHSPPHNSTHYTTPTTIELLKGKEGELNLKKNSTPKRERDTHTNTQTHKEALLERVVGVLFLHILHFILDCWVDFQGQFFCSL
jgi:hypothetical protein